MADAKSSPSSLRMVSCIVAVFAILFVVPFFVYSGFAFVTGMEMPEESSPGRFMASVVIEKIGHAISFVLIFCVARSCLSRHWVWYAFAWWVMFALGELAAVLRMPTYTWEMAVAGIIAEAIYLPLSAYVAVVLLGAREKDAT